MLPEFTSEHFAPIDIPTVLVHGTQDDVVPPAAVKKIAQNVFTKLEYISVDDGHRLHKAFEELDWENILA
jgi:alpha/beta superfamily hydrolase